MTKIAIQARLKITKESEDVMFVSPKRKNIKAQTKAPTMMIGSWECNFIERESKISLGG